MNPHTQKKANELRAIDPLFDQIAAVLSGDLEALARALALVQAIEAAHLDTPDSIAAVQRAAVDARALISTALDAHRALLASLRGTPLGTVLSPPATPSEGA